MLSSQNGGESTQLAMAAEQMVTPDMAYWRPLPCPFIEARIGESSPFPCVEKFDLSHSWMKCFCRIGIVTCRVFQSTFISATVARTSVMNVTFWGVRGTIPTPQRENLYFGGETA